MEEKDGFNGSGFTIKGVEIPQSFRVEPRIEHTDQPGGGSTAPPTNSFSVSVNAAVEKKKKRGRPRKYGADGSIVALSPVPISASIPFTGEYSSWKGPFKKKNKFEFGNSEHMMYPVGGGITPHLITVNPGEDVMKKIISFSQQGYRAICILAANGFISNVTLRQLYSSGGTLTYEGYFEILSLTGSFMPNHDGVTKSRSGGLSVSFAGPDGRVLGGGLAGVLVASGPVQLVIGSFVPEDQMDKKPKKQKYERTISFTAPNTTHLVSDPIYSGVTKADFTSPVVLNSKNSFKTALQGHPSREQSHEIKCQD